MVIMKFRQTHIGQHIKWYNDLIITTRITLIMDGRSLLMNGYSGDERMINQEEGYNVDRKPRGFGTEYKRLSAVGVKVTTTFEHVRSKEV